MSENSGDLLACFIIGGLIGVTIGILFAPKSGKETREDINRKADELIAKAKEGYEKAARKYKDAAKEVSGVESFRDYQAEKNEELI
ncbi:MAG TPA: YtxH domain-containing protein [Smithella sp.]|nr:YtxH domain-containing protein [Smithella sp.]